MVFYKSKKFDVMPFLPIISITKLNQKMHLKSTKRHENANFQVKKLYKIYRSAFWIKARFD